MSSHSSLTDFDGTVLVTGANGLIGRRVCRTLSDRGVSVRAMVRRPGTAPDGVGITEHVGDFTVADDAATAVEGIDALVTTAYPLTSGDRDEQRRVSVEGTEVIARAAAEADVPMHVHVSTAAVYDRSPGAGDVAEDSPLVGDDAGDYPVLKRETDAMIAVIDGPTRVLVRPPAVLGPGETSVWNTVRPQAMREDVAERTDHPDRSFAWIHVDDLAALIADVAIGEIARSDDPARGPVPGACTPVNAAGEPATARDYVSTVCDALGVEPVWQSEGAVWSGRIVAERAHAWGWRPQVRLEDALEELAAGLRG